MQVKELEGRPGVWGVFHEGKLAAINGQMEFEDPSPIHEFLDSRGFYADHSGYVVSKSAPPADHVKEETPASQPEPKEAVAEEQATPEESTAGDDVPVTETTFSASVEVPEADVTEAPTRKPTSARASLSEEARKAQDRRVLEWRKKNPDKVKTYRDEYNRRRRERYKNDPDYRARVQGSTKAYQKRQAASEASDDSPQ